MLIGNQNSVNQKLTKEISEIIPMQMVDYSDGDITVLDTLQDDVRFVVVNLMDIANDMQLISHLKVNHQEVKLIGIHCFENEVMINSILAKGYDAYISIFNFSEKIGPTLKRLGAQNQST